MRNKIIISILGLIIFASAHGVYGASSADESKVAAPSDDTQRDKSNTDLFAPPKESLQKSSFVLETDEQSANESLNRISGNIDLGFSAPENTYQSEEHAGAGPFAKEKAEMKKQSNQAY